jgi:hypothetical protein
VAVRGPQHRDVGTDVVEPDDLARPRPLDLRLPLQLHTELDEERLGPLEILDDDENVVHPLKRHVPEHTVGSGRQSDSTPASICGPPSLVGGDGPRQRRDECPG